MTTSAASLSCWDRLPQLNVGGYQFFDGGQKWAAYMMLKDRPHIYANISSPVNCSFFDDQPNVCSNYTWRDESPEARCCSCQGGTLSAGPSPPAPPSPPYPPSLPCHDKFTGQDFLQRELPDGGFTWGGGFKSCDWFYTQEAVTTADSFQTNASGTDPCHFFKWTDHVPTEACCACRGGSFEQPLPPPVPPSPPPTPPVSPLRVPLSPPAPDSPSVVAQLPRLPPFNPPPRLPQSSVFRPSPPAGPGGSAPASDVDSDATAQTSGGGDANNGGVIASIVIACTLVPLLIAIYVYWYCCRHPPDQPSRWQQWRLRHGYQDHVAKAYRATSSPKGSSTLQGSAEDDTAACSVNASSVVLLTVQQPSAEGQDGVKRTSSMAQVRFAEGLVASSCDYSQASPPEQGSPGIASPSGAATCDGDPGSSATGGALLSPESSQAQQLEAWCARRTLSCSGSCRGKSSMPELGAAGALGGAMLEQGHADDMIHYRHNRPPGTAFATGEPSELGSIQASMGSHTHEQAALGQLGVGPSDAQPQQLATRSVSLKELSHLRSLISAGMEESEAHRVLEAARNNPQAREYLESVLRAQGSGLAEGEALAAYQTALDPRLQELEEMERNGQLHENEGEGGAPEEGLSVHTWPPRGGLSLEGTRAMDDLSRVVRGGRLAALRAQR